MSTEKTFDPKYLARCVYGYADLLLVGRFPAAAQILKSFAKVIEAKAADNKFYDENYPKLETVLRKEFCLDNSWRSTLFEDTDAIIKAASQAPEELQIALRLVEPTKVRQEKVNRIMFVATKETNEVSKMYLLCFVYLLLLQGIYDQFIRFLYALHKKLATEEANLRSIKTQFIQDHVGATLFDGWNRIVRNAIAHSTFTVNETAREILFEDRIAHDKKLMSFSDFEELTWRLFDVGTLVLILLILRVLVPMNYREALKSASN